MDINDCAFTGRLGSDATVRHFESGRAVIEFNLASDRGKDQNGNDRTTWVTVKHWVKSESQLPQFLTKGKRVGVFQAELVQEKWVDRETGGNRSKLIIEARRVVLLDSKSDTPATGTTSPGYAAAPSGTGWDGEPDVEF